MVDAFVYDGTSSEDFGVHISGVETFARPGRDRTMVTVPGRNGDLVLDNGRYENVEIRYTCFIRSDFRDRLDDFMDFLAAHLSYAPLRDSYHPDEERQAVPDLSLTPRTGPFNKSGTFTVSFNCKPQRYLLDGLEEEIWGNDSGDGLDVYVTNPTNMIARPTFNVWGSGTINFGSQTVQIAVHSYPYITIDSEMQDAHYGAINCNSLVTLTDFPVLPPGRLHITSDAAIDQIEIIPRWWRL